MKPFPVNTHRFDPYKNFKFRVKFGTESEYVAGVSKVSALKGSTEYDAVTLERGVTHSVAFEQWANKVWNFTAGGGSGKEVSLKDFRKDVLLEVYNEAGQLALRYKIFRCWVSEYQPLGEFDAN